MTDKEITEKLSEWVGWDTLTTDGFKNPLENISHAWELMDELLKDSAYMSCSLSYDRVSDSYKIFLRKYGEILNWNYWPNEKTAPRAICKACLKIIEDGDESHG